MSRFGDALDNYITGHYGEDQYPPGADWNDPADDIPVEVHDCDQSPSGYLHTLSGQLIASYYCEDDNGTKN